MNSNREHMQSSPPPMHSSSLVCVGGMLRVASPSDPPSALPPSPSPSLQSISTPARRVHETPFKTLASPFTASAPFTAPTTPLTTNILTPLRSLSIPTPVTQSSTLELTPQSHPAHTPDHDFQPQPQTQLLTQKQVRELRRLCRKTANRAQFEDRLIQIRQVASIAAMASSSIHLFDPDNASSGHALRSWVEKHRAEGADWRDERLLTDEAVDELRRWDRCLKAWARVRFEPQSTTESRHGPRSVRTEPSDQILQPVRLQFEQLSLASPPSTPFYAKTRAPATVSDLISFASPVTPDNPNFLASPARFETPAPSRRQTPYAQTSSHVRELQVTQPTPIHHSMIPGNEVRAISQMTPSGQATSARHFMGTATETTPSPSAWSKPPLLGLARRVDARKPLSEVSINRVGNTINVTVPTPNQLGVKAEDEYEYSLAAARPSQENINPRALHRNPSAYSSTSTKSWRNAVLEVPKQPSSEDERIHAFRMAAKNLFVSEPNEPSAPPKASPALRTDIDWGNLRRRNFAGSQPAQPTTQARPHDA